MPWQSMRREPAISLTTFRVWVISSEVSTQVLGGPIAAPLMQAMTVSLSKKISLT
jgi:hypothetical protein